MEASQAKIRTMKPWSCLLFMQFGRLVCRAAARESRELPTLHANNLRQRRM